MFEVTLRRRARRRSRCSTAPATRRSSTSRRPSIAVSDGTIVVGTDYGAVKSEGDGSWAEAGKGLPHVVVADLVLVPGKKDQIYAGTHGQGVWTLKFK